jgi:hypothetical protein
MVTRLKELVPCDFDILNLDSPTAARYRVSPRALYSRIRRYDAAVFAFTSADSPALALPAERLPVSRLLVRRIPAAYLADCPLSPSVDEAIEAHSRAWRLLPLGTASATISDDKTLADLASAITASL